MNPTTCSPAATRNPHPAAGNNVGRLGRKWLFVVVGLCALGFSPPGSAAAGQAMSGEPPSRFIIGISPFLDKAVKDEVYRGIVRLVVEDLPLNSALAIYDAFELKTITQLSLPDARAF